MKITVVQKKKQPAALAVPVDDEDDDVADDDDASPSTADDAGLETTTLAFASLDVSANTKKAIAEVMKYQTTTPVQAEAIPPILEGKDVFVKARTGGWMGVPA